MKTIKIREGDAIWITGRTAIILKLSVCHGMQIWAEDYFKLIRGLKGHMNINEFYVVNYIKQGRPYVPVVDEIEFRFFGNIVGMNAVYRRMKLIDLLSGKVDQAFVYIPNNFKEITGKIISEYKGLDKMFRPKIEQHKTKVVKWM